MEKKPQFTVIAETTGQWYGYTPDGTQYSIVGKTDNAGNKCEESTGLSNHTPIVKKILHTNDGYETKEEVVVCVLMNGRKSEDITITLKDILSQNPNIKFGAACRIFLGRGVKAKYSEAMQIQCEKAPVYTIYQHTGYAEVDGKRVFLNGGYSVTEDGLTDQYNVELPGQLENYRFTSERSPDRFKTLLTLLPTVAHTPLIYAGLGLSFLTPLNALLRDKGIEPCFILYFTGKTGSRKTTLAKLFLNFFGTFDNGTAPPASFRDTVNAVEMKFALTDSTLVLLDDRIPSVNPKVKNQMENMEQATARQIGDRSARGRLNADSTLKTAYRPKCNLIITAEESFSNVGESAIARSISVELKPSDVNLSALTEVQQKAEHLNQCMSDYIRFVLTNWDSISDKVKPMFLELRNKAQSGGHGRLAECVAHLQIGIIFMCEWLISEGVIDEAQAEKMKSVSWEVFVKLAERQNRRITEEKPVKLFLNAVREMRDRNSIRIVDLDSQNEYNSLNVVGYRDKDFYYFYPEAIYREVKMFYSTQDTNFPLGKTALFQQLAIDNLIETDKEQNTKSKRIKDGKRPRFLWLKAAALDDEREEDN